MILDLISPPGWTMPRPALRVVAALLGLVALGAFVAGVLNAPERGGRMPGQKASGQAPAAAIDAPEAMPLSQDRIEAPKPVEKPASATTDEDDDDAAAPVALNATPATPTPPAATNATPTAQDRVGDLLQTLPPPDEPPH